MFRFLVTRRDGAVEYVTLNRPEVRNAFNEDLIAELTAWAATVTADETIRCAVLAGAGPVFCAGADLTWMSKMVTYSHDDNVADASAAAHMYAALDQMPVPLIGRIVGAALGGGAGLAAVCDIVVADEAAMFGFTEVKFGIVPAMISPYVLAKIGYSATRELFLTGMRFNAQRARELGLVHAVTATADLDRRVDQYVREILSAGPEAVTTAKSLIREIAHRRPADVAGITTEAIATRRVSEEGQEGMNAFLEKRKATWNVSTILIANRGEIAVRLIRGCRELGVEAIAVYSDADAGALHVAIADGAVRIGPPAPAGSYLSIDAILGAARETGADAIHPGYGFLSENPRCAAACAAAGVTFIGPPAAVLEQMGSKIAARLLAKQAGVPVVPGETPVDQSDPAVAAAARRVGLPVLIKPSAGGGGIGMKTVRNDAELIGAIAQARREAAAAFGDGTLYVERLVDRPRHIEFQILADHHGHVVHLFERECSIQRRHQKIVEETPSPVLTPALRRRMGEAAVAVARAAGYRNAGTVEFLLEGVTGGEADNAAFYFLEMNTRLQVEHPITEQVTGVDLVRAQIAIAAGEPLPWSQETLSQRGHAIEARIYAEDPAHHDLPQAGPLLLYREPSMPGIRVDSGVTEGGAITVHYDPMIAKLIAFGESRDAARQRAIAALRNFPILGIRTNIPFLVELLQHPRFVTGDIDTRFLDAEGDALRSALGENPTPEALAVAAAARQSDAPGTSDLRGVASPPDPWTSLRGYRV